MQYPATRAMQYNTMYSMQHPAVHGMRCQWHWQCVPQPRLLGVCFVAAYWGWPGQGFWLCCSLLGVSLVSGKSRRAGSSGVPRAAGEWGAALCRVGAACCVMEWERGDGEQDPHTAWDAKYPPGLAGSSWCAGAARRAWEAWLSGGNGGTWSSRGCRPSWVPGEWEAIGMGLLSTEGGTGGLGMGVLGPQHPGCRVLLG